jgi:Patatin-like phospholipase
LSAETWTTYPALPHALPFRTVFGEYRARRPLDLAGMVLEGILRPESVPEDLAKAALADLRKSALSLEDLAEAVATHILKSEHMPGDLATVLGKHILKLELTQHDLARVWTRLDADITKSERAYRDLGQAKEHLQNLRQKHAEPTTKFKAKLVEHYERVLLAERRCQVQDAPLKFILYGMEGTAVCLSGGGIRSASFSLGILEGLARFSRRAVCAEKTRPLLDTLDYLSTVSGGGYIGSWLMAWSERSDYHQVVDQLAAAAPTSGDPEPQPIRHLREYTSYLSPHFGFTLDTLTLLSIVMRNMILNWLILVPVVIALFCLPQFLYNFSYGWAFESAHSGRGWFVVVMALAVLGVVTASATAVWRTARPTYQLGTTDSQTEGSTSVELWFFALPILLSAWLIGEASARAYVSDALRGWSVPHLALWLMVYTALPPMSMAAVRASLLWQDDGGQLPNPFRKHDGSGQVDWGRLVWSFVAPIIVAALAALMLAECALRVGSRLVQKGQWHPVIGENFVVLVVPIVLVVMMLASTLLSGLLTHIEREEEREWWARAGGLLFACMLCWLALNSVAFFAKDWLHFMSGSILGAVGLGAGYIGSAAGLSAATTSGLKRVKAEQLTTFEKFLNKHGMIAPVASGIALLCLALMLAGLTSWLRAQLHDRLMAVVLSPQSSTLQHSLVRFLRLAVHVGNKGLWVGTVDRLKIDSLATFVVFAAVCLLALFANKFININTFSLHGMYRMRLTRSYLGASNFARHPDAFTNFDSSDNMYEAGIPCNDAPLHVINAALNLVATRNMAWQQRKAEPFTFSAVSVGSWRLGYLPTEDYGGSKGVTLGTAMAISGAAFNPNMGYNSSPLVTLLMTFFNARLGWWLPNPIWPHLRRWPAGSKKTRGLLGMNGPKWALMPLLNEALGNTDDSYKWIELSDGGHFENLGLYEMVLRRCRHIIVVDADADSEFQFEDLGNAIRKIEIDLGIPITFPDFPEGLPMEKGVKPLNIYCIRGLIQYGCVDDQAPKGELLFIKPMLNGSEPPDIRAYAASHQTFPHEATSNQFFNEAQFESYRHLGSWMISSYFENAPKDVPPAPVGCDIATFFARIASVRNTSQSAVKNSAAATASANPITLPAGEV